MPPGLPLNTKGPLMLIIRELVRVGRRVVVDSESENGASVEVAVVVLPSAPGRLVVATKMGDCLKYGRLSSL